MSDREERSEGMYIYVTPTVAKEYKAAATNKDLEDTIIKNFLKSETNWLSEELKSMDEQTIKYKAKLIGIKEAFGLAQDSYVTEIEAIHEKAYNTLNKLNTVTKSLSESIKINFNDLVALDKRLSYVNVGSLERLLTAVDRFNDMTSEQKQLIKLLLDGKEESR